MCGIIGYTGLQQALPILIDGLSRLEYRGYDSAGVVVYDGAKFRYEKCPGKIDALKQRVAGIPMPGTLGIGHTRWATHGGVTEMNAHPHFDCKHRITLVHNGIIENYAELRRRLGKKHKFRSETDTEIVAHLLESHYAGDPLKAMQETVAELRGSYAIVAAFADHPDVLVGARLDAPLVVGINGTESFLASDIAAVLPHTRQVQIVDEGQIALLKGHDVKLFGRNGAEIALLPMQIDWEVAVAAKDGFAHYMLKEIHEQPKSTAAELHGRLDLKRGDVVLDGVARDVKNAKRVVIAACGTAWHSGLVTKCAIEEYARLPVDVGLASELRYGHTPFDRETLFLAISQSGETADTIAALRSAKKAGARTLAITNIKGSTVARESDGVIFMRAGLEVGVAATKTYTSQLMCGVLFAIQLGRWRGTVSPARAKKLLAAAQAVPDAVRRVLDGARQVEEIARLAACRDYMYIGRRYHLATAFEGALKMKEISYLHAEGYGAGEMKHGPIAIVDSSLTTIAIAPRDNVYDKMVSNIEQIRARRGRLIVVATEGDEAVKRISDFVIPMPRVEECFSPVVAVVPLQLFAYATAISHGLDPDKPRNLAKTVTVE